MGEWIQRKADEHVHDMPRNKSGTAKNAQIGDTWRCNCGKRFQIKRFESGMHWDPIDPAAIIWEQFMLASPYDR